MGKARYSITFTQLVQTLNIRFIKLQTLLPAMLKVFAGIFMPHVISGQPNAELGTLFR